MSDAELVDLLLQARTRNQQLRLTGMLLYKDQNFMQVLEGKEANVMRVFASIEVDKRHKSVDTLRAEYIPHRNFPDWTMGFANVNDLDPATMPGFSRFMERNFRSEYFTEDSIEAHAMLLAFKGLHHKPES